MKKNIFLSLSLIILDQIIKAFVRCAPEGSVYFRLPGFLELTHVTNTGAAFSLFSGSPVFLTLVSAILLLTLCMFLFRSLRLTNPARTAAVCLLAGGAGNLLDRMIFGGVTDYIRLLPLRFPVFNFADILVTGSIFALMILLLCGKLEYENTEEKNERNP